MEKSDRPVGDEPSLTETQWRILSVTSAIFTVIGVIVAFAWIFHDGFDGESDLRLAQTLSPFGVALFAAVTFCTASWRGLINARQLDITEREGRAKLLQEGAKLLAEREKDSHVSAGIATLEILIAGPDSRLGVQAMNLIADFVQSEMAHNPVHKFQEPSFAALATGAKIGRVAERTIRFSSDADDIEWIAIRGVSKVLFEGGRVEGMWGTGDFPDDQSYRYKNTTFLFLEDWEIDGRFDRCKFRHCSIRAWKETHYDQFDNFERCDFSNASISLRMSEPKKLDLKKGSNYFREKRPPTFVLNKTKVLDPKEYLMVQKPGQLNVVDEWIPF